MKEDELKCKLEQIASALGVEIHDNLEKKVDPIYTIFKMMIIFGFMILVIILATLVLMKYLGTNSQIQINPEIVYVDKIIEKIEYRDRIVEVPVVKYKTVYKTAQEPVPNCSIENVSNLLDIKEIEHKTKGTYYRYQKHYENVSYYFTEVHKKEEECSSQNKK